jgi:hypothetical protein
MNQRTLADLSVRAQGVPQRARTTWRASVLRHAPESAEFLPKFQVALLN